MATEDTLDFSGMTMSISGDDLINLLLPRIITALAKNSTLLSQLTQAVTKQQLVSARSTGSALGRYAGGNQTGTATKTNTNAISR